MGKTTNIELRNERLGQKRINAFGEEGVCIGFVGTSSHHIYVEISDDKEIIKTTWHGFNQGSFHNTTKRKNYLNQDGYNTNDLHMKIIEYRKHTDIDVLFDSGYIARNTSYTSFKKGAIKDRLTPSVVGMGYIGDGPYNSSFQICGIKPHSIWVGVLNRCYKEGAYPNYYKISNVCDEWLNYQNFAKWVENNVYYVPGHKMQLDKDILIKGNKLYSPETCCFVTEEINSLFTNKKSKRSKYCIGVADAPSWPGKYRVDVHRTRLGDILVYVDTVEEGFKIYKREKEKYIKYIADIYKDQIPQKIYDALYAYEVEITD